MCESTVFLEEGGKVREMMKDVTRIVMRDGDAVCTDIVGEQLVLEKRRSHGGEPAQPRDRVRQGGMITP